MVQVQCKSNLIPLNTMSLPGPMGPWSIYLCLPFSKAKQNQLQIPHSLPKDPTSCSHSPLAGTQQARPVSTSGHLHLLSPLLRIIFPKLSLGLAPSLNQRGLFSLPLRGKTCVGILCAILFQIFCEVEILKLKKKVKKEHIEILCSQSNK